MIGGMEDEEWARRQREWAEWRERQLREWEEEQLRQRKTQYRRERDDINRGHWEVTEPLTPDEENELRELKNYELWEEFVNPTTNRPDWRLRDPNQQPRYEELAKKDRDHKGSVNFLETRLPPRDYYNTRRNIQKNGLGLVGVQYEREPSTGFHFARIYFPRNFQHLTNPEGRQRKRATSAGYHVTLGYHNDYTDNPAARAALDNFANKYRNYQTVMVPKVSVSSGDTYEILGNSDFCQGPKSSYQYNQSQRAGL